MDRRKFIIGTGLALAASPILTACQPKAQPVGSDDTPVSFETWEGIRKQFQFEVGKINMSQMLLAAHPKSVRDAIAAYRSAFDSNPAEYWENNFKVKDAETRKAVAAYTGTEDHEIALTDSTTMGLGILYSGLKLKPGEEILTTFHDHYATEKSLEFAAGRNGAVIKRAKFYDDPAKASVSEMAEAIKSGISSKTRIVAITYVHSCTGVKTPVKQIAGIINEANFKRADSDRIYFCVDGAHGFGIENVSLADLGCDFFAASAHKWIFGPRGTGILYGKKNAWHMISPVIPSFEFNAYGAWLDLYPGEKLTFGELCTPGGFHSFEYRWALKEAFEFQLKIGKKRVEDRTHQLGSMLKDGLSNIKHIKLITPRNPEISAGINCFMVDGMKPEEVVKKLADKKITASTSPYKTSYARLTPSIINSEEDVSICIKALEEIKGSG